MQYEEEPVAKRYTSNLVQYVCHACGGWQTLVGSSERFLPFIDHLIRDLAMLQHPALRSPRLVGHQIWYQLPDRNEMICGLPPYEPDSNEWKRLLAKGQKILPQAKFFLLDIADWLEKALSSLEGLKSIRKSDLLAAEQVLTLMPTLAEEFQEQREYLLVSRTVGGSVYGPQMVGTARSTGGVHRTFHGRRTLGFVAFEFPGNDSSNSTKSTWTITAAAQDPRRATLVGARRRNIRRRAKTSPRGFDLPLEAHLKAVRNS